MEVRDTGQRRWCAQGLSSGDCAIVPVQERRAAGHEKEGEGSLGVRQATSLSAAACTPLR